MVGANLTGVTHCKFGTSAAGAVPVPSVEGTVVCARAAADGSMGLDGLPFGADTLLADGALYGSVPVLLSRTGADGSFFHTAASFYYYPPPHSFGVAAPIYPGGGPLGMSTNISLAAGDAARTR